MTWNPKMLAGYIRVQLMHLSDGDRATEKTAFRSLRKLAGMFGAASDGELRRAIRTELKTWRRTNTTP